MRKSYTSRTILDAVGCKHLSISRGRDGYNLIYDDISAGISDVRAVTAKRISDWPLTRWISEAKAYVAYINGKWRAR